MAADEMAWFVIACSKSLNDSLSSFNLTLSVTGNVVDETNVSENLLMFFPSIVSADSGGKGREAKPPGVAKETVAGKVVIFGAVGYLHLDNWLVAQVVPLSHGAGRKQGNLGRSLCHVARRCEYGLGSRTVATRRGLRRFL